MKFIVALLLTAFLGYVACLFLPWWGFAITSFVVAVAIFQKPGAAFLAGFTALFLLWGVLASILDEANGHLLSQKVAQILPLQGSYIAIILVTALLGGLVSGMAATTGSYLRKL